MKKRWPSILIGLAVSLGALAYLLNRDLDGTRRALQEARYGFLIPYAMLCVAGQWVRNRRWLVLLDHRLPAQHSFNILNIGYFLNGVLPLRIGELVRVALVTRQEPSVRVLTALGTVFVERLLDVLAVLVLSGLTLLILPLGLELGLMGITVGAGSILASVLLVLLALRPGWAHHLLNRGERVLPLLRRFNLHRGLDHFLEGIVSLGATKKIARVVGWTAAAWIVTIVADYVVLHAVFDQPTWAAALALTTLAAFAISIPAVPGNLGPFEAAIVFALAGSGLAQTTSDAPSVAFALLLHLAILVLYSLMGLIGLWGENVRLNEIIRAARSLRQRQRIELPS